MARMSGEIRQPSSCCVKYLRRCRIGQAALYLEPAVDARGGFLQRGARKIGRDDIDLPAREL
jgi:hypothetical protein